MFAGHCELLGGDGSLLFDSVHKSKGYSSCDLTEFVLAEMNEGLC